MNVIRTGILAMLTPLAVAGWAATPEPGEEGITAVLARGIDPPKVAPLRGDESRGPFDRLLITNAMLVDGTGAPPIGPVDIEIRRDRITSIRGAHTGAHAPDGADIIDVAGGYVLPGFVDAHVHLGTPSHAAAGALTDPEYVLKLWLAHGVTTVRDVGAVMGLDWTIEHRERAAAGEIAAPRMRVHSMFPPSTATDEEAVAWVKAVRKKGADGVKFRGARPGPFAAAMAEAKRLGMKTSYHHAQLSVVQTNVLDSARLGLDSMEHWYGLPEAMFEDRVIQDYPLDYNYANEQDRFGEAGKLWLQAAAPGSETWERTIAELVDLDFTLSPTFTIYEASRDEMRARNADWMDDYVPGYMARAFTPNPKSTVLTFLTGPRSTRSTGSTTSAAGCSSSTTTRTPAGAWLRAPTRALSTRSTALPISVSWSCCRKPASILLRSSKPQLSTVQSYSASTRMWARWRSGKRPTW
jgi:hypothetical protein